MYRTISISIQKFSCNENQLRHTVAFLPKNPNNMPFPSHMYGISLFHKFFIFVSGYKGQHSHMFFPHKFSITRMKRKKRDISTHSKYNLTPRSVYSANSISGTQRPNPYSRIFYLHNVYFEAFSASTHAHAHS